MQSLTSKLSSWLATLLSGVGLISLALAVHRSTLPYNSEGNYFDGMVNYHAHSVVVYGVMAGASFFAALMLFAIRLLLPRARQGSEVRCQRSDVRGQRSEVRDQRSEVRDQRSEIGSDL